jgi:predicted DNA-binding transcriptional regulator YafY
MSKAERLIEMLITINAKRDFTAGELAEEFSVSKRTILRDLRELEEAGFPLYSEVGAAGGYHILKERILPPIVFSESVRTIIPVGLYAMNGLWYCPAYCMSANQIRTFRVDRIREILEEKPCPKGKYPIPVSIQEYLERTEIKKDYHLKIRLTDIGVKRCESECMLAGGLKTVPTGGGIIDMEINREALEWVADYILPLGKHATVLEPAELSEIIRQKIYELQQHYCES